MPRGGARKGSGRKPRIPLIERFAVCARFQREWGKLAEQLAMQRHKVALPYEEINESRAFLNALPLRDRKQLSSEAKQHLAWLGETLEGHRVVHPRRPQGEREALIRRIAAEESERRKIIITPRMLKRWLIEYRRFLISDRS